MNPGAVIGIAVGYFGWVLGLAFVAVRSSDDDAFVELVLPVAAVTLGLAGSLVGCLALLARRTSRADLMLHLFGRIAFDLGLIGLLLRTWIMPRLRDDAATVEQLRSTGSAVDLPWQLGWPTLAVGALLLTVSAVRLLRASAR